MAAISHNGAAPLPGSANRPYFGLCLSREDAHDELPAMIVLSVFIELSSR